MVSEMSTQLHTRVDDCVAAVCSAYQEGFVILQNVRAKKKVLVPAAQELEGSLIRGETTIKDLYDRTQRRFGEAFSIGDKTAQYALQEITTQLQGQVIASLKSHWQQDASINFTPLQDVSDSSQDKAILALLHLQQRMVTLAPIQTVTPAPLDIAEIVNRGTTMPDDVEEDELETPKATSSFLPSTETTFGVFRTPSRSLSTKSSSTKPVTPPGANIGIQYSAPLEQSLSRVSIDNASIAHREANQYKPMATTVTTTKFFGLSRKTKVEPVVSPIENPLVDEYLAEAIEGAAKNTSRRTSISTTATSMYEPAHPTYNSWQDYRSPSPTMSHRPAASVSSFEPARRYRTADREVLSSNRSITAIKPEDLLPSEMNDYAGFCKGAWRQQIGDRNRAMEARVRPGGMYNDARYWQCKHCRFEGRLVPVNKKLDGLDMRVFQLVEGIQFRWEFMFKSHVPMKEFAEGNPTKATFGCMFCCADGRPTSFFNGIQDFMRHLVDHRDPLPIGEVLYRMNCLVGRRAAADEDFDINIIAGDNSDLKSLRRGSLQGSLM